MGHKEPQNWINEGNNSNMHMPNKKKITVMKELTHKNALAKYFWNVLKNENCIDEVPIRRGEPFTLNCRCWKYVWLIFEKSKWLPKIVRTLPKLMCIQNAENGKTYPIIILTFIVKNLFETGYFPNEILKNRSLWSKLLACLLGNVIFQLFFHLLHYYSEPLI